jgi:hypothetical protein
MRKNKHGYRVMAVFIAVLLLSACATPYQTRQLRSSPPPGIPLAYEITTTPFYPQRDYQCGPAALATVINHFELQTSAEELIPLVYIPELKGSLQIEMVAAARQFGMLAIQQDGRLESLLREVSEGNPVLVLQNLGLDSYPFWHYAVVIGYDLDAEEIILRSGEVKRLLRPFTVFERTWQRAGFWSVVVVPPQLMPQTASQSEFIRAVLALEPAGMTPSVLMAYQNGVKRWPQNFILHMGLGNAAYALRRHELARQAFSEAASLMPGRAEAWNNLAYALIKTGQKEQALEAVKQALKLQPNNAEYLASQIEILTLQ